MREPRSELLLEQLALGMAGGRGPARAPHRARARAGARRPPSGSGSPQRSRAPSRGGEARAARRPAIDYPPELPVAQRADEIARTIRDHPVVIVCGETGSGKTTQLPKICLAAGRGERGLIGHTQPRRIAARAVAARIAQELGTEPGDGRRLQGALHRPHEARRVRQADDGRHPARGDAGRSAASPPTTRSSSTRRTSAASTSISCWATSSSSSPRRPDLKVIITSATLDADRFARHFGTAGAPAPVIEVSGRDVPGRRAVPAARPRATTRPTTRRSSRTRSSTRSRTCGAAGRATSWCSCPASARSAKPARC